LSKRLSQAPFANILEADKSKKSGLLKESSQFRLKIDPLNVTTYGLQRGSQIGDRHRESAKVPSYPPETGLYVPLVLKSRLNTNDDL
jgi:hypothetical protein